MHVPEMILGGIVIFFAILRLQKFIMKKLKR